MSCWPLKLLLRNRHVKCLGILLLSLGVNAQGFRSYFNPKLTPKSTCSSKFITETSPGNYVSLGITTDSIYGIFYNKLVVTGINSQGVTLWSKYYGSINGFAYDLEGITREAIYHQGHIYFTSWVGVGGPAANGTLMKIDPNGNLVWQKIYSEANCKTGTQMVCPSVDGGFLICGTSERSIQQDGPALLIKTDSNGNELWRKKYSKTTGINFIIARSIKQDPITKRIVIAGQCCTNDCSILNPIIIVADSLGNEIEQRILTNYNGVFTDLTMLTDGSFVAVGCYWTDSLTVSQTKKLMLSLHVRFKCDSPQPLFIKPFDRLSSNNCISTVSPLGANGNYVTTASIDTLYQYWPPYSYNEMLRVTVFDSSGNMLKSAYYDFKHLADPKEPYLDNHMYSTSAEPTSDGGMVIAIRVNNWTISNPIFNVKLDSTGCDSTLEYCKNPTTLEELLHAPYLSFYPVPTQNKLYLNVPMGQIRNVSVHSISGQKLLEYIAPISDSALDVSSLPDGVYFLELHMQDGSVYSKKLVVQK